jgi:coenzyme PQQ synthesis protein D (PqqD)
MLRNPEKANEERNVISDDQFFVRSRAVVSRVVAGETLIVPVRGKVGDLASIYSFNETGSLIWKLLDTPRAVREVVGAIAEEYQVDTEQVRQDVLRFLGEMRGVGLIEISQIEVPQNRISQAQISQSPMGVSGMSASEISAVESGLAEVPEAAVVARTEGPVGRDGLAADAR